MKTLCVSPAVVEKDAVEQQTLMLFDLALGGHHGAYLKRIVEYGHTQPSISRIYVVVTPAFLTVHADVVAFFSQYEKNTFELIAITSAESKQLENRRGAWGRLNRNLVEWSLFCRYAKRLAVTQALLMYLDTCEVPLTLGLSAPCPFSGIYFRPSFYYGDFEARSPSKSAALQRWRNRFTLKRLLSHPQLTHLFCLDTFAAKRLSQTDYGDKAIYLPDPTDYAAVEEGSVKTLRERLNISPNRKVFLLFGALDARKGIYQLLEAIHQISEELCQQMCLILAGKTDETEQAKIQSAVQHLLGQKPVQIVEQYEFIPDSLSAAYFQLADVVLAPYQQHVGMSGILLTAAAAGKPVLSSHYGLMGQLTHTYELGLTVDSTSSKCIAQGLEQCISKSEKELFNAQKQTSFSEQHHPRHFSQTIFQHISQNHILQKI